MEMPGRIVRQISLFSLLVLIAPMILFPDLLGVGLSKASVVKIAFELIYYGVVIFFFCRRAPLLRVVQGAFLCLGYRLLLGVVFGLLIATMYSMNFFVCLTLGLTSYWPAILLQMATTPFILRPIVTQLTVAGTVGSITAQPAVPAQAPQRAVTAAAVLADRAVGLSAPVAPLEREATVAREPRVGPLSGPEFAEANGFDRAVRYIGGDASVQLAMVVDHEGLLLGQFRRGEMQPDDWAPFALLFYDANRKVLKRASRGSPERIDLVLKDTRFVVAHEESWCLMVVAQRHGDDILSVKINQGCEIIRRYVAQRYGQGLSVNAEKIYVSSA